VNAFFEDLGRRWAEAATRRGVETEPPELDPALANELLELARVAAHTQERRFAPLAAFMAGVAVERLRLAFESGGNPISASELSAYVQEVRQQLELERPL